MPLSEKQETRGNVSLQIPGRMRWDYVSPQPGVMMIRDGTFERYVPQTKQVFRGPARGEADLLVGFGPGAADLGKKYEVTLLPEEKVGAIPAYVLDLRLVQGEDGPLTHCGVTPLRVPIRVAGRGPSPPP